MLLYAVHTVHLLTVILWIGGLGFITILMLPMIIRMEDPLGKVLLFNRIEQKFAPLARVYNVIVGVSGFTLLYMTGAYRDIFTFTIESLPLLFMAVVWVFWAVMLFVLEPIVVRKMIEKMQRSGEAVEI
ncbi:MAG: hypothetical protein KAS88_06035, partial [Deltaproteobacteria bacterium]|nr:hypothetical protein [Deltaproteobacteria bacterium]